MKHCFKNTKTELKQKNKTKPNAPRGGVGGLINNLGGQNCLEILKLSDIVFIPLTLVGIYMSIYISFLFVSLVKKIWGVLRSNLGLYTC